MTRQPRRSIFVLLFLFLVIPSVVRLHCASPSLSNKSHRQHTIPSPSANASASIMPQSSLSPIQQISQSPARTVASLPRCVLMSGTRQFCLDYRLPICRGATNDPTHGDDTVKVDISTVCFRISHNNSRLTW
jgi:hypothetical protein